MFKQSQNLISGNVFDVVGNTPLIHIQSLSRMTGCQIYGKAEFLNPGGSVKDRAAKGLILKAEREGLLKPGMTLVEGTAGNTGIGLATLAAQRGYKCIFVLPENQAPEKYATLRALGAEVIITKMVPFTDENHFFHKAKKLAAETTNSYWVNQFENLGNFEGHYQSTGPEIWQQTNGQIDIFATAAGSGGTIAGVSSYLKEKNPKIQVVLIDPDGSGMKSYVETKEIKSNGISSVTEGIGIMRVTENFKVAKIDKAINVNDQQMISMLYHVSKNDGLLVGTSAALNLYGAYQLALDNKNKGLNIVTTLCDSGLRYQSRVFNSEWLSEKKLMVTEIA